MKSEKYNCKESGEMPENYICSGKSIAVYRFSQEPYKTNNNGLYAFHLENVLYPKGIGLRKYDTLELVE